MSITHFHAISIQQKIAHDPFGIAKFGMWVVRVPGYEATGTRTLYVVQ